MKSNTTTHFEISERKVLLRIFDVLLVWLALYLSTHNFEINYLTFTSGSWVWLVTLGFYILLFGNVFEIYDLQKAESRKAIIKNLILTCLLVTLFFLLTPVLTPVLPENRFQILYFFGIMFLTLIIWRFFYIVVITSPRFFKRVLIIGDDMDIDSIGSELLKNDPNYEIKGFISSGNVSSEKFKAYALKDLQTVISEDKVGEIVVVNSKARLSSELHQALIPLLKTGFPIKAYAHVYEDITSKVSLEFINNDFYLYFPSSRSNQNRLYLLYNRFVDILVSTIGLVFCVLLLPVIGVGNLIGNRGSLFYKQLRLGKFGNEFHILKFRTMVMNAEPEGAQLALKKDTRVTAFGRFLRGSRLDELPQFYNVLKGDMSLIGPRPERPEFVETLSAKLPFYEVRQIIKPGLTGWGQVNTRYANSEEDMAEKLQYDLYYIKHRSVFLDMRILLKTITTVIFFRGQ
ncbi:sugar transferase [Psychroflexus sp. YR1-1]|uniref:Sugar transferase n=1 Tax=Psychroflexus aurantiacus TaxID=2709310 RepID=A0A6B3R799_9FLAO|nr:sugar transferase [Psychroflexus aurantiacus]NEV93671.1 sugar transferase [Psychroflexus aurantiacus]